tara:strand:- start:1290 stop:2486 length:1197 start_codon:yes stop_codon:yes gene_type:complete
MAVTFNVGIVLQEPFPIGMAATNRVLSYAVEIAKINNVKVYIPLASEYGSEIINKLPFGNFEGIEFEYISKKTIWPIKANKIIKLFIILKSVLNLLFVLKKDNPKVIIFYCNKNLISSSQIVLTRLFTSIKIIIEESEYPKMHSKKALSIFRKLNFLVYRIADGMIVMTNELKTFYKTLNVNNIFVLPMTVNFERFNDTNYILNTNERFFAYVGGSGGFKRDGLLDSVIAFNILHKKYNEFKFYIIGPLDKSSRIFLELEEYIFNNNLEDSVLFLGVKLTNQIPGYLQNALALIMTPPKDFVSGGFPTKLGEYLASGTPVITTDVSNIGNYLNSENSFLVKPGDTNEIYLKMTTIIENQDLAKSVGENGRITAESIFGAKNYIKEMEYFLFKKNKASL